MDGEFVPVPNDEEPSAAHDTANSKPSSLFRPLLFGQLLAFAVAVSALVTKLLFETHHISSPALQNTLGYVITWLVMFLPWMKSASIPKRYVGGIFVVAVFDSQADFLGNLAYSFGVSIASVGMLSSFTIPCVMLLSYFLLSVRYSTTHYVGTIVALIGLGFVIAGDVAAAADSSLQRNSTSNGTLTDDDDVGNHDSLIGDILILVGSALYAVSNVCTEALVKSTISLFVFLFWLSTFGSSLSLIQFLVLESNTLSDPAVSGEVVGLFVASGCMFMILYTTIGKYLQAYDSVLLNLSFLTTDVWGLVFGVLVFHEQVHALKIVGFFFVVMGVVIYNRVKPYRPPTTPSVVDDDEDDNAHTSSPFQEFMLPIVHRRQVDEQISTL